jgi:hypothetical protein
MLPRKSIVFLTALIGIFALFGSTQILAQDEVTPWDCVVTGTDSVQAAPTQWTVSVDESVPFPNQTTPPSNGLPGTYEANWKLTPGARKTKALSHLVLTIPDELCAGDPNANPPTCTNIDVVIDGAPVAYILSDGATGDSACSFADAGSVFIKITEVPTTVESHTVTLILDLLDPPGVADGPFIVKAADCGIVQVKRLDVCEEPPPPLPAVTEEGAVYAIGQGTLTVTIIRNKQTGEVIRIIVTNTCDDVPPGTPCTPGTTTYQGTSLAAIASDWSDDFYCRPQRSDPATTVQMTVDSVVYNCYHPVDPGSIVGTMMQLSGSETDCSYLYNGVRYQITDWPPECP